MFLYPWPPMTIGTTGIDNVLKEVEKNAILDQISCRSLPEKLFRKVILTVAIFKGQVKLVAENYSYNCIIWLH